MFVPRAHLEDEQDEEQHQEDLNADDEELGEEVSQHRLHGAHTWRSEEQGRDFYEICS